MKSIVRVVLAVMVFIFDAVLADLETSSDEKFLELSEPDRNIGGAYCGVGFGLSRIVHNINATKSGGSEIHYKKGGNQLDISMVGGFGSAFYRRCYAGIEMEFFKRFNGKTSYHSNGEIGIVNNGAIGLNMDVRFGYLLPRSGSLVYMTLGFARVLGQVIVSQGNRRSNGTFGSFYPTFGLGIEHKINHLWNIRGDFRGSIASKDDNKQIENWKYDAKPSRIAFRISIVRNI